MRRIKTFGIELEGGVYYHGTQERVNLCEVLGLNASNNFHLTLPGVAAVGTDNGYNELEFSIEPCGSLSELEDKVTACVAWLRPDWEVYWTGQDPFVAAGKLSPCPWAPKPRYGAIREVVARESGYPNTGQCMDWMSQFWAYQIHLAVDPVSVEGMLLRNYLDNWGPHIARSACEIVGSTSSQRIERAWINWGDSRRLPAYRWFNAPTHMIDAWQAAPRLAREEKGIWVPDTHLHQPLPGDVVHEGFVWWGARPRWTIGTIEFRWPDSLPPAAAIRLSGWILSFAEEILKGWRPYRFSREEWEDSRLSREHWLEVMRQYPDAKISF